MYIISKIEPTSHHNSGGEQDFTPEQPALGIVDVFQQLCQRGGHGQGKEISNETEYLYQEVFGL